MLLSEFVSLYVKVFQATPQVLVDLHPTCDHVNTDVEHPEVLGVRNLLQTQQQTGKGCLQKKGRIWELVLSRVDPPTPSYFGMS